MEIVESCPWCGQRPVSREKWFDNYVSITKIEHIAETKIRRYSIKCCNIECTMKPSTPYYYEIDLAIETWNRRYGNERT